MKIATPWIVGEDTTRGTTIIDALGSPVGQIYDPEVAKYVCRVVNKS